MKIFRKQPIIEPILLTAMRVSTFENDCLLTNASGFFFEREGKLFLVTSRHVMIDAPSKHYPDRLEIELNTDAENLTKSIGYSISLYRNGKALWNQAEDGGGNVDVAAIEVDRTTLPEEAIFQAFKIKHFQASYEQVEIGSNLLIVGFPLGFHDTLHHMPVARHAVVASSFGMRFQGEGYFLTDARTHRGMSGAPVVMRVSEQDTSFGDLPWILLGIHSARFDVGSRDLAIDEALGLNCAWYADILLTLTEDRQ